MILRSTIEEYNEAAHNLSQIQGVRYDSLNVNLDKYSRCFDLIDLILQGGMTVVNAYTTFNDVKSNISELKDMIEKYAKDYAVKGNVMTSDSIVINACHTLISQVGEDGEDLVKSIIQLAVYTTGTEHVTSAGLLSIILNINDGLDRIRNSVDRAYFVIWRYLTVRFTYFKKSLFKAKSLKELSNDAIGRWKKVARKVGY